MVPEMLLAWASSVGERECAVLVLPTQYAAQRIKASLVSFREWDWDTIRLVTGVDKEDPTTGGGHASPSPPTA